MYNLLSAVKAPKQIFQYAGGLFFRHPGVTYLIFRLMKNSPKTPRMQWLEEELETEAQDRLMTQEALARAVAENMYLKSVLAGLSPKPVKEVLKSGKAQIRATYRFIVKTGYESLYNF